MKKLLSIILIITLTLTLFTSCGATDKAFASTYLNLGEKYLTDLDYEQALVCFKKAIEVEPKNERAYLGAAEAYVALGDIDSAIAILEQGIEAVDDPTELQAMLAELLGESKAEVQDEVVADEVATDEDTTPEAETTPEETATDEETEEPVFVTTAEYYYDSDDNYGYEYEYDSKGYVVKLSIFASFQGEGLIGGSFSLDGNYGYIHTYYNSNAWNEYEYDSEKRLTGWKGYSSNSEGVVSVGEFAYDSYGNMIRWVSYNTSGEENRYANYEYNTDNQLIKSTVGSSDGYFIDEYNSNGKVAISYTYDSGGKLDYWRDMEYDLNGNYLKITYHDANSSEVSWSIYDYEYDSNGNVTKYSCYNSNGELEEYGEYSYEYDSNGQITYKIITTYDSDGNLYSIEYQTRIN